MNFLNRYADNKINAINDLCSFTKFFKKDYIPNWFHKAVCEELTEFAKSEIKESLMLFAPPQHGKSELSTRKLPCYLLALNPKLKIVIVSYNQTTASSFGRDVSKLLESEEFANLYPLASPSKGELNNSSITETKAGGYIISVGVGGSLTSKTADVIIIDDIFKGPMDAWSPIFRERVWNFYTSVIETRGHNKTKTLILYTRWHDDDLAGRILQKDNEFKVLKFEAIKTNNNNNNYDKREIGEALYPERHSLERLRAIQGLNKHTFQSLYQQDPKPIEGMLYKSHRVYKEIPIHEYSYLETLNYTDTADEGEDYLASICWTYHEGEAYITDIIYTQEPMEITEPLVADMLRRNKTQEALIESNNGGKGFARQVQTLNKSCRVEWFHQSNNKRARIFTQSSTVTSLINFPHDWEYRFSEAYKSFTGFQSVGKNAHDDFEDCITGVAEQLRNRRIRDGYES